METELKLLIDPADARTFTRNALVESRAVGAAKRSRLHSIYFDTPDLELKRHGLGLRVRRDGRRRVQTLKDDGEVVAGLHRRHECESAVAGDRPELDALFAQLGDDAAWAAPLRDGALAARLEPVFTTRFTRWLRLLELPGGERIELALDEGEIACGHGAQRISEVELELKAGEPAALFDFALQLLDGVPLRLGGASKAERGYALVAPQPQPIVKAAVVELDAQMTVERALQAVLGACLAQIQGNEAGVLYGSELESIHQMRVGLRRLRSALRLFGGVVALPAAQKTELDWLGGELGAARDWEVLAAGTLAAAIAASPQHDDLVALQSAALDAAGRHRRAAAAAVATPRYARLLLQLAAWTQGARGREALDARAAKRLSAPLAPWAGKLLARAHARLVERGERLPRATPQERHRLRITAKNVRYAVEFFQRLYPAQRVARYVGALAALQDALGWLNDVDVAQRLLERLAEEHPDCTPAARFAAGWLAGRSASDLRDVQRAWRRLRGAKPPWAVHG